MFDRRLTAKMSLGLMIRILQEQKVRHQALRIINDVDYLLGPLYSHSIVDSLHAATDSAETTPTQRHHPPPTSANDTQHQVTRMDESPTSRDASNIRECQTYALAGNGERGSGMQHDAHSHHLLPRHRTPSSEHQADHRPGPDEIANATPVATGTVTQTVGPTTSMTIVRNPVEILTPKARRPHSASSLTQGFAFIPEEWEGSVDHALFSGAPEEPGPCTSSDLPDGDDADVTMTDDMEGPASTGSESHADATERFRPGRMANEHRDIINAWIRSVLEDTKRISDRTGYNAHQLVNILVTKITNVKVKFNSWNTFQQLYREDEGILKRLHTDGDGIVHPIAKKERDAYAICMKLHGEAILKPILETWQEECQYSGHCMTLGDRGRLWTKAKDDMIDRAEVNSRFYGFESAFVFAGRQPNDDQNHHAVYETKHAKGVCIYDLSPGCA